MNIRLTTQHKFLSLILDALYLNWKAQIENLITIKKLNVLKALIPVKRGASINISLNQNFYMNYRLIALHQNLALKS